MDWKHLFTSFDGRISRQPFWVGTLILAAIEVASGVAFDAFFGEASAKAIVCNVVRDLILLYPSLAVATKRWHDRDKSGWWNLLVVVADVLGCTASIHYGDKPGSWHLLWFVPAVAFVWFLAECGFLRGTPGPNRFGSDPLGHVGPVAPATAGSPGQAV